MRAVALDEVPGRPALTDLDRPRPGPNEVLVKVSAAALNGFDALTVGGHLRPMLEHRYPLVPGKDFAGTVWDVGDEVSDLMVGEAVFGVVSKPYLGGGSFAEHVTTPGGYGIARLPNGLTTADAGALGLAGTAALDSVDAAAPDLGETALIAGATGGVGAFAVQLAAARGARVLATARPGTEAGFVQELTPAELVLVDYADDLAAQVRAAAPAGVDVIIHLAGDGATLAGLLRPGGRLVSTLGLRPHEVGRDDVVVKPVMADSTTHTLTRLGTEAAAGALRVPITATYPLAQVPQALADFQRGALGKLAIQVAATD